MLSHSIARVVICTVAGIFLAALSGCRPQAISKTQAELKVQRRVVAMVNGSAITTDNLRLELEALPRGLQSYAGTVEGKDEFLDYVILRELLVQEAAKEGITGKKPDASERRAVIAGYLNSKLPEAKDSQSLPVRREQFRYVREKLVRNATIIIPEEDGVDGGDEANLSLQQVEFLRHRLELLLIGGPSS